MTTKKYHFKPEMCDVMIEMGKSGASQKMIWSELGINKDVAKRWCKDHPDFADALELAKTHSQAYWEREILANVNNKAFNSRVAEIALRGQYPDDYKDNREIKANIKQEVVVDFNKEIGDLIAALKE